MKELLQQLNTFVLGFFSSPIIPRLTAGKLIELHKNYLIPIQPMAERLDSSAFYKRVKLLWVPVTTRA